MNVDWPVKEGLRARGRALPPLCISTSPWSLTRLAPLLRPRFPLRAAVGIPDTVIRAADRHRCGAGLAATPAAPVERRVDHQHARGVIAATKRLYRRVRQPFGRGVSRDTLRCRSVPSRIVPGDAGGRPRAAAPRTGVRIMRNRGTGPAPRSGTRCKSGLSSRRLLPQACRCQFWHCPIRDRLNSTIRSDN